MSDVSLRDVAAAAGVSFQTVSKALNGTGSLAPATRARIQEAADRLGYVPNALARSLHGRGTYTIGVLTADFSNTAMAHHLIGVEREAGRRGLAVFVTSVGPRGENWQERLRGLLERRVDGVIVNAPVVERDPRVPRMLASVPAVALHGLPGDRIPWVGADPVATARLPLRHLLTLGHRRIGMVTGEPERGVTRTRNEVYAQVLAEHGVPFDAALVEPGDWDVDEAYHATHRIMDRAPDCTALYAQNDAMAIGVLAALHDRGLRVPEDCAVVGCDGLASVARTVPPLATVRIPFREAGETAVRVLAGLLAGDRPEPGARVTLPVEMIYRASSGGPRPRTPAPSPKP